MHLLHEGYEMAVAVLDDTWVLIGRASRTRRWLRASEHWPPGTPHDAGSQGEAERAQFRPTPTEARLWRPTTCATGAVRGGA